VRSQKAIHGGKRSRKPPSYLSRTPSRPLCAVRNKVRYPSEAEADVALVKIRAKGPKKPGGRVPIRSYFCTSCGGWHLTSIPKAGP
jgi:hypothetical protein